jgi:hypothetical protein
MDGQSLLTFSVKSSAAELSLRLHEPPPILPP